MPAPVAPLLLLLHVLLLLSPTDGVAVTAARTKNEKRARRGHVSLLTALRRRHHNTVPGSSSSASAAAAAASTRDSRDSRDSTHATALLQTDAGWSDIWSRDPGSEVIGDAVVDQNIINVRGPYQREPGPSTLLAFSYRSPAEQLMDQNAPGDPKMAAAFNVDTNMAPAGGNAMEDEPGDVSAGKNGPDDAKR